MFTAEHDPHTSPWHAEVVRRGLPGETRLIHRVVENVGHFSFMSPFPNSMRSSRFPPGNDPEGFDREAFQTRLSREVLEFLGQAMMS